jgi:L-alanine-DL-glutamate epimerase-like enolase superfamily enzyme
MTVIRRVHVHEYRYELSGFGASIMDERPGGKLGLDGFVVVIETDDGQRGEYAPHYGATRQALAQVIQMAPMLIGRDPEQRVKIFEDLKNAFRHYDKVGLGILDTALWDLAGKKHGIPVARLLGGYRDRLPVYASTYPGQKGIGSLGSANAYADFAQACREQGFPAFKIHAFWDGAPQSEIAVMTAVRRRVGDGMKLMTDPASSLPTFIDALTVGRACDELGFFWYEDPYRDSSASAFAHGRLRQMMRTPLLIGEHVRGFEQKADFLTNGGTDILHIDPELDGGITGTIRLATFAAGLGMDVQLHTAGPMHRHCMAAIPNTHFYELALVAPGRWNGFQPPIYASTYTDQLDAVGADGCVPVPDGPGLGVVYDWDKLQSWATARHEIQSDGSRASTATGLRSGS